MRNIIETIKVASQKSSKFDRLSDNLTKYYSDIAGLVSNSSQFHCELLLRGWTGGYINEELGYPIWIDIFDNKVCRLRTDREIIHVERMKANGHTLWKYLRDTCEDENISVDDILGDMKFNFGLYDSNKDESVKVIIGETSVSVVYNNKSKFSMLKSLMENRVEDGCGTFGGTLNLQDMLQMGYNITEQEENGVYTIKLELGKKLADEERDVDVPLKGDNIFNIYKLYDVLQFKDLPENGVTATLSCATFVMEILSNIIYYNYRDFDEVYAVWYKGIDIPVIVPVGYEESMKLK